MSSEQALYRRQGNVVVIKSAKDNQVVSENERLQHLFDEHYVEH